MSYPTTLLADYTAPLGGGGGPSGISIAEFNSYKAELDALVAAAQEVNDSITSTTPTWSSNKIAAEIAAI